jgi:peptidoglycan/LPS O-acetylase OafA/YrhL
LLALAWQNEKTKEFLHKHVRAFRWSCFLLFLVLVYFTYWKPAFWDIPFPLALFYGNLILLVLLQSNNRNRFDLFQSRVLEWFGLRSYGIYLFHKPVLILTPFVLGWLLHRDFSAWTAVGLALVVLVIVSEVSYRLLEKPIMDWGHRFKYERPPAGGNEEYAAVVRQESLTKP